MKTLESMVTNTTNLVSFPDLYFRLEAAIKDPNSSSHRIADVIRHDTDLSARLLRLVNSAFFGFPGQIDSISRAMTIVGVEQLRDLSLATIVMKQFDNIDHELVSMASFWKHSVAVGVAARNIAILKRDADVERFFLMGIIHDIGRLVLFLQAPNEISQAMNQANENKSLLISEEKAIFSFTHAQMGQALLKQWKLPMLLQETAAFHHAPDKAIRFPSEVAIIHLSDIIVNAMEIGSSGEKYVPPMNENAWEKTGLSNEDLEVIFDRTQSDVDSMSEMLGLNS